jgi:hypothetical protein
MNRATNLSSFFIIAKRIGVSKFSIRQVSHLAIYSQFRALACYFLSLESPIK